MTTFDDDFNAATFPSLIDLHGESIGFRANSAGATRTINALVDRDPPQVIDGSPEGLSYAVIISVYNSATTGIASTELDEGTNVVLVSPRQGVTAVWMSVRLIDHDSGLMRLGLNGGS